MPERATAETASCQKAVAALMKMPEVEAIDEQRLLFAYKRGGGINLYCATGVDLTIGVSPLPGPEFWPFFGRLARIMGVDHGGPSMFDCRVDDNFLSLGVFKPEQD
jgi:hypothetical protein